MPGTILAIHAHPDDESSKGASTVAKYVARGARAVLITATGGEAGDILNPEMDSPEVAENLAEVRAAELVEAARIIGYDEVVMLGYRDSGMPDSDANHHRDAFCRQPFDDVLERLVGIVRHERPDVVLGYDAHEFYPHPDHLRVHRLSVALVDAAADEDQFPGAGEPWKIQKLYAPVFTIERIKALHEAMIQTAGESPFEMWLDRLNGIEEPERRLTRIDVTGLVDLGRDALRAHRTQVDPDGFWFQVPTDVVESVYPWEDFEVLHTSVGWSEGESDLFAGVVQSVGG
jgi:mycothiol S-conjugate amidase